MTDSFLGDRGDYFAEGDYLATDVRTGVMRDRAGARMLALPEDFLTSLGRTAASVRKAAGRGYGRRLAERLAEELEGYYGEPIAEYPLARLEGLLSELFSHHGWGRPRFDFSHYAVGVLVVGFDDPAEDELLTGVLAGLFSHLAGEELDCLRTQEGTETRFVLTLPQRLAAVADRAQTCEGVLRELETTRA
jgi:hypothetical protein